MWLSKKELNDKQAELKRLQNQPILDVEAIKLLDKEIGLWLEQKDMKWKQKAKRDWYKGGYKNTKFFHTCVSQRWRHNKIQRINNNQGRLVSKQVEIKDVFKDYFQQVYTTSQPTVQDIERGSQGVEGRVSAIMNLALIEHFNRKEVLMTLQ